MQSKYSGEHSYLWGVMFITTLSMGLANVCVCVCVCEYVCVCVRVCVSTLVTTPIRIPLLLTIHLLCPTNIFNAIFALISLLFSPANNNN